MYAYSGNWWRFCETGLNRFLWSTDKTKWFTSLKRRQKCSSTAWKVNKLRAIRLHCASIDCSLKASYKKIRNGGFQHQSVNQSSVGTKTSCNQLLQQNEHDDIKIILPAMPLQQDEQLKEDSDGWDLWWRTVAPFGNTLLVCTSTSFKFSGTRC